jgi:hypothetical protein
MSVRVTFKIYGYSGAAEPNVAIGERYGRLGPMYLFLWKIVLLSQTNFSRMELQRRATRPIENGFQEITSSDLNHLNSKPI